MNPIDPIIEFSEAKSPSLKQEIAAMEALATACDITPMIEAEKKRLIETRQAVALADAAKRKRITIIVSLIFWPCLVGMGVLMPAYMGVAAGANALTYLGYWSGLIVLGCLMWFFCVNFAQEMFL